MKRFSFLTTCSLCLAFSQAVQAQFFTYEIESMTATDIGTLGGEEASAMDINDLGQMTGWAMLADGTSHAFLYSNGSMVDVTPSFATMKSMGRGINNNAEIVGKYDQPVGNTIVYKPFYWSQYEVTPKTLAMVGGFTEAIAINDNGLIVGGAYGDWGDACGFKSYAVRWQNAYLPIEKLYCPGFNLTITIEAALGGGVLFLCRDGCIRDLASVYGSYRSVDETGVAIQLIGQSLAALKTRSVSWVLDRPVSNSGRLAKRVRDCADQNGWPWTVETAFNPDREIVLSDRIAITSDGPLLDQVRLWTNFNRYLIEKRLDEPWLVDLSCGEESTGFT